MAAVTELNDIPTWVNLAAELGNINTEDLQATVSDDLNTKISLWQGDMTKLKVDAIVNAANNTLLGGGGIDGAIHRAAGRQLVQECRTLKGCETGDAKITAGYDLPAKHVIHTVGPIGESKEALQSCYNRCLEVLVENDLRTICFCCISTGIYGYPPKKAALVALQTVRSWLEEGDHKDLVDRIIFCTFLKNDFLIYKTYLPKFFPLGQTADTDEQKVQESDEAFEIGESVLAKFLGTEDRPGRVVKVNSDRTIDIEFENGAKEVKVSRKKIKRSSKQEVPQQEEGGKDGSEMETEEQKENDEMKQG